MKVRDGIIFFDLPLRVRVPGPFERGVRQKIHALLPAEACKEAQAAAESSLQTQDQGVVVGPAVGAREIDLRKLAARAPEVRIRPVGPRTEYRRIEFRRVK